MLKEWVVLVIVAWGVRVLHIVVEHRQDQGARPTLMEGYNYCITCYLGIITVNEEEGYLLPTITRKITCRCFRANVKEVRTNITIYSYKKTSL